MHLYDGRLLPSATRCAGTAAARTACTAARTAAAAGREVGIVKEKRIIADEAFRTLCTRVNALVLVNGEAPYGEFIDRVNVIIAQAKAVLASRETRAKKKRQT